MTRQRIVQCDHEEDLGSHGVPRASVENGVQGGKNAMHSAGLRGAVLTLSVMLLQALTLLDHLVKSGTERVVENARDHMFKLRQLSEFSYHDGSADKGAGGALSFVDSNC